MTIRIFKEQSKHQGKDEKIAYKIDTTPWGGSPSKGMSHIVCGGVGVCADHLEGEPQSEGNVITTPLVVGLVPGNRYRLEVKWTCQSNTLEAYGWIIAGD
jgi:hypothetical protein